MKVLYNLLLISGFVSVSHIMVAQNSHPLVNDEAKFTQVMMEQNLRYNTTQREVNYVSSNQVSIVQIGQENIAKTYSQSLNTDIYIYQKGERNFVDLDLKAKEIQSKVFQLGDNNIVHDFVSNSITSKNTSFIQNGSNLQLYSNGANSISKDMKVYQSGNNKTIYIFNR